MLDKLIIATAPSYYDELTGKWDLIENVPLNTEKEILKFELAEFTRDNERSVNLDVSVIVARAKQMGGMTGKSHAELILNRAFLIPLSWEGFYLLFPGTVRRASDGFLIPALQQDEYTRQWTPYWHHLSCGWHSPNGGRIVRIISG